MRRGLVFILSSVALGFFLVRLQPVSGQANNKFGIHVTLGDDLDKAAQLVNANGGDWGYVTVVIAEPQRDQTAWQDFFDRCREKHLIPIIRLATRVENGVWVKPSPDSLAGWADFLDNLNWPVKKRLVIVFNEPNHAKEWGGQVSPDEYARTLDQAISVFKKRNSDFYVLNAGLDQAAPNSVSTMDELAFLVAMNQAIPGIFDRLDGWSSHSYPNHGFVGKPWDKGRATIRGYEWELSILKNNFGVGKDLPVFITETGWPAKSGKWESLPADRRAGTGKFYDQEVVAEFTQQAFEKVWLTDNRVVAITPFILNYPNPPFANFSWLTQDGQPLVQYQSIQGFKKDKGEPAQEEVIEFVGIQFPSFLPANFIFGGKVYLKNIGQSIWGEKPFGVKAQAWEVSLSDLNLADGLLIKPGQITQLSFFLQTPPDAGEYWLGWAGLPPQKLKVFEVWSLTNRPNTFFNRFYQRLLLAWYEMKGDSG